MNLDGTGYSILHNFAGFPTDGQAPHGGALALSGNAVYGMTLFGGSGGGGTVFRMNIDGSGYSVLQSFTGAAADGGSPLGQLAISGSKLFGFTVHGGSSGRGALFSMDLDGSNFSLMHSFQDFPGDGDLPIGEPTISGSTVYGSSGRGGANALGALLRIGTDGSNYDVEYSFTGAPAGGDGPVGQLIQSGSTFFGMNGQGGLFNDGTIFSFAPVPEPSFLVPLAAIIAVVACRRRRKKCGVS